MTRQEAIAQVKECLERAVSKLRSIEEEVDALPIQEHPRELKNALGGAWFSYRCSVNTSRKTLLRLEAMSDEDFNKRQAAQT